MLTAADVAKTRAIMMALVPRAIAGYAAFHILQIIALFSGMR